MAARGQSDVGAVRSAGRPSPPEDTAHNGEGDHPAAALALVLSSNEHVARGGRVFTAVAAGDATFALLDTGAVLWGGAKALAHLVECPNCGLGRFLSSRGGAAGAEAPQAQCRVCFMPDVVELGAGAGIPGLVAAALAAPPEPRLGVGGAAAHTGLHPPWDAPRVLLTDVATRAAQDRLARCARANLRASEQARVRTGVLDFGSWPPPRAPSRAGGAVGGEEAAATACGGARGAGIIAVAGGGGGGGNSATLASASVFVAADILYDATVDALVRAVPCLLDAAATGAEVQSSRLAMPT